MELFLNDDVLGEATLDGSKFVYEDLDLKSGDNTISAIAKLGENESEQSKTVTVVLDRDEPKLEIESPTEGQTFGLNNRATVSGTTDKDAQVYANGFLASVDFEGKFEVLVPIPEGESTIEIKALDSAGNTKIEKRKVNFRK